jgi:ABC-type nitrate/sulfonate/bicarbonate transport system substrate-binding protein
VELTLAHYRNRFCMYRTYYAISIGLVRAEGIDLKIVEVADPPSRDQENALIDGQVQIANMYLANFLRRKLEGAPIIGLSTEWKSTGQGNGLFVRSGSGITDPAQLAGKTIATHQGRHAFHQYLLRRAYGVDDSTLNWIAFPQQELLGVLQRGEADAAVLLDQFFFRGLAAGDVDLLYTDGDAWRQLTGFPEMIKHMIAIREDVLAGRPWLKDVLLQTFRESFAYSERNLTEVADVFLARYGGDREALLASAHYPKIEFTFTDQEQRLAEAEMKMLVDVGQIPHAAPVGELFAS